MGFDTGSNGGPNPTTPPELLLALQEPCREYSRHALFVVASAFCHIL